jgi:3-hydroxyisobutyrate dehydrogenase-like beta-hydroxyacid dehydrogenase
MAKDMDLVLQAARETNVPVPLAALVGQAFEALIAGGDGELDFFAAVRLVERAAGLPDAIGR